MTEWGVVAVLTGLLGLLATVAKPMLSLNSTITRLNVTVEKLAQEVSLVISKNSQAHLRLWEKNKMHDSMLRDHECRIGALEALEKGTEDD